MNLNLTKQWLLILPVLAILHLTACASKEKRVANDGDTAEETPAATSNSKGGGALVQGADSEPVKDSSFSAPASKAPGAAGSDPKYQTLGQTLRGTGKGGNVQDEATKLLGANPNDPVALNALALLNLRRGRPGAAKLLLNRALEKNQPTAALLNNLGLAMLEEGEVEGATAQFKKALHLDDRNTEALGNLGSIYAKAGDYLKAHPLLEQSYKQNRSNVAVANNYAICLRANKDYEGAKKVYDDVMKVNSKDVGVLLNYAILLIDFMNKPKEGLDLVYKVQLLETERKDVLARANALAKKAESELK